MGGLTLAWWEGCICLGYCLFDCLQKPNMCVFDLAAYHGEEDRTLEQRFKQAGKLSTVG